MRLLEEKPELKNEALEFWNKDEKFAKPITLEKAIKNYNNYIGMCDTGWSRLNGRFNLRYQYTGITKNFCRKSKSCWIDMSCSRANYNNPRRGKSVYWLFKVNSVSPLEEIYIEKLDNER
jgi:hypothetical protein